MKFYQLYENFDASLIICSCEEVLELIKPGDYVISFCDDEEDKIKFPNSISVKYCVVPDIERDELGEFGFTEDTYINNVDEVTKFICEGISKQKRIICQCEYGQGRSAGCAAAILQYVAGCGIEIFADYALTPNKIVYHRFMTSLGGQYEC